MARRARRSIDEMMPAPTPVRNRWLGALTAAAQRITARRIGPRGIPGTGNKWQQEAWELHKAVPEQRFIVTTLARRIGQARLYIGTLPDDAAATPDPVDEKNGGLAFAEAVGKIIDGLGAAMGMSQILDRIYVNLNVAGECWLVGIPPSLIDPDGDDTRGIDLLEVSDLHWQVLSVSEIAADTRGTITVNTGDIAGKIECDPEDVYLIRIWSPDPEKANEADSPTRSLLPVLRELVGLTMHVSAQVDSRLAGAGLLAMPQSASRAMRAAAGLSETDEGDPLTDALIESMMTPISDRDSAAALVPLVLSLPDESVDKIKYISFATPLDEHAMDLREESIRRIGLGQDAPPELLLGTGDLNHWSAWSMREDVVFSHLEPPLQLICSALTTQLLRPVLMDEFGMSSEQAAKYVVWYDVAHLIARPTRGADALTLFNAGLLSGEATRAALGFDETDAPAGADPAIQAAMDIIKQAPSLLATTTLGDLVESIRAVMTGAPAPIIETPAIGPAVVDDAGPSGPPAAGPNG